MRNIFVRLIIAIMFTCAGATTLVWACGPFIFPIPTVTSLSPADDETYARGDVGVVRPRFRRANLVLAYRAFAGRPPLGRDSGIRPTTDVSPFKEWQERRAGVLGALPERTGRTRRVTEYYTSPFNCLDDAFRAAVRTLEARQTHYGAASVQLRDWVRAQDAVFANCEEEPLMLPEPAPAGADALTHADRAYQTAAAYFYGWQFEEAERRFRAIGNDASSPWRPYGRFLAARSQIRLASVGAGEPDLVRQRWSAAERELLSVIEDPIAAPVHESARGLLTFVRIRLRPAEQLREISDRLTSADGRRRASDMTDFTYLMDRIVGDTVEINYDLADVSAREGNDLVDWVLAFQGQGSHARDRAIAKWRQTTAEPWLIAALRHLDTPGAVADDILRHAASVPASSPSYATVSFYRVRMLISLGRVDEARQILAALPDEPRPGFSAETINLLRGERVMIARTLEEFLTSAFRSSVPIAVGHSDAPKPLITFDEDAAAILSDRMPLDRLVDAALSEMLPARVRMRVAIAAFTRAILLNRHDAARRVAPALGATAPVLAAELGHYLSASGAEEQRWAAVVMMLRTPGITRDIFGLDDTYSVDFVEPRRDHESFTRTWWCAPTERQLPGDAQSELIHLLYPDHIVPYPSFIGAAERDAAEQERTALNVTGPATRYLATVALARARTHPSDPDLAEALSRIVNGWRRACRDQADAHLARGSFQQLHRLFPNSDWAKRTRYWYR